MTYLLILFALFSIKNFVVQDNFCNFATWIERTCKPFDKGMLTAFPHFKICQHKLINVSSMLKFEDLPEVNSERWLSLEDLDGEVWKDVVDYEGNYKISNYGRVKSLKRDIPSGRKYAIKTFPEKILKAHFDRHYCYYDLCKNGAIKKIGVHRIVATAFITNTENKPQVDHIDTNPTNNCLYNLRWCTARENNLNEITRKRHSDRMKGCSMPLSTRKKLSNSLKNKYMASKNWNSKQVAQYDKEGNLIKIWPAAIEAARVLGYQQGHISACCRGERPHHHGYIWRYVDNLGNIKKV